MAESYCVLRFNLLCFVVLRCTAFSPHAGIFGIGEDTERSVCVTVCDDVTSEDCASVLNLFALRSIGAVCTWRTGYVGRYVIHGVMVGGGNEGRYQQVQLALDRWQWNVPTFGPPRFRFRPQIELEPPSNGACTQAMAAKRILYLHESALSHAEYTQYVESFDELVEGDRTQLATVSVREVRGWLKGRYATNNTVDAATIDKVLHISLSPPATSVCSPSQTQHRSSWLTSGYLITLYRLMLTPSLLFPLYCSDSPTLLSSTCPRRFLHSRPVLRCSPPDNPRTERKGSRRISRLQPAYVLSRLHSSRLLFRYVVLPGLLSLPAPP